MKDKQNKVFLVVSHYGDGRKFEEDLYSEVYSNMDSAKNELRLLYEEALECFRNIYDEDDISVEDLEDNIEINAFEYSDWWEGYVVDKLVKD